MIIDPESSEFIYYAAKAAYTKRTLNAWTTSHHAKTFIPNQREYLQESREKSHQVHFILIMHYKLCITKTL
jgi:hypothetical protein